MQLLRLYKESSYPLSENCLHPTEKFEAKDALLVVLESVAAVKENFRQEYIIDFVKGRATDDIVSHKHDEWTVYSIGGGAISDGTAGNEELGAKDVYDLNKLADIKQWCYDNGRSFWEHRLDLLEIYSHLWLPLMHFQN